MLDSPVAGTNWRLPTVRTTTEAGARCYESGSENLWTFGQPSISGRSFPRPFWHPFSAVGHREAAAQADLQPPTIVSRSPAARRSGVSTQASVLVTFDEPIAPTSLTLSLRAGTTTIAAAISYNDATRTATLDPNADLAGNTLHTVDVRARDVAGNLMPATVSWTFTTATPAFQQSTVISGLTNPTVVEFARDGRVFIAEKSGIIKVFDNISDTTATVFADLRTNVYNYHDRGLLGMALHPDFPSTPVRLCPVRA